MLDAYIIEEIKRQEEERRRREEARRQRIHIDPEPPGPPPSKDDDTDSSEDDEDESIVRIDIDKPTIPANSEDVCSLYPPFYNRHSGKPIIELVFT